MWNILINPLKTIGAWLHHAFDPHCDHCAQEKIDSAVCDVCEVLKMQLELANIEKKQLLDTIVNLNKPRIDEAGIPSENLKPLPPRYIPFSVRKQALEQQSRLTANKLREKEDEIRKANANLTVNKSTDEIERELGIGDESSKPENQVDSVASVSIMSEQELSDNRWEENAG